MTTTFEHEIETARGNQVIVDVTIELTAPCHGDDLTPAMNADALIVRVDRLGRNVTKRISRKQFADIQERADIEAIEYFEQ